MSLVSVTRPLLCFPKATVRGTGPPQRFTSATLRFQKNEAIVSG